MYLSAAFMQLLRAPDEDSGPCSSLIIQHSSIKLPYRTRHIDNTSKQSGSKPLTPSTCNDGRGGQDTGQCVAVPYPDPFFLHAQCQLTVDGHVVDWDFVNLSTFLAPVSVNDIKLLSSSNTLPPCSSQKGNPPFPPWFLAFFLLKLFIFQCLGNELHPSSSNPYGTKHTLSFGNDQDGSNKKPRQDDDDDDDYPYYPDDCGDNEHNDNNDGETPDGKRTAKGKEKEEPLYCCAFYKLDPVKYRKCGHLEIKSVAYFLQHIIRQHLLDDKYYHCDNCRIGWPKDGKNSDTLWENHTRAGTCERVTLEELGKLLPEEHRQMKRKLREKPVGSEFDRWYKVWEQLFPEHKRPDSPYLSNEAEEIEASNVRRLDGVLEEELSQVPPGAARDRMEAFARRLIERAFPAHARQGSANAGPSTPRVPRQVPQAPRAPAPTPTPRSVAPVGGTRTPVGNSAPQHRLAPNTNRHPRSTGFPTNPGLMMNQERMSTRPPTNHGMMSTAPLENPVYAMYAGFANTGFPVDPQRMNTRFPGNPALTMNSGMMNTAGARYRMNPGQANLGQMHYGPPANPGNPRTINPSVLTMSGSANPGPSTTPPSDFNRIQNRNMNSFRNNNNAAGLDLAALESDVGSGVSAYFSSLQNPSQSPDTDDDCPETVQNPFQRIQ